MNQEQIEQAQIDALGKIWELFQFKKADIAKACNVNASTVSQWYKRGRISATGAIMLERHPNIAGKLTKEDMRPDVDRWFGV